MPFTFYRPALGAFALLITSFIGPEANAQDKALPFGNGETLLINVTKGTYSVRYKTSLIINAATAAYSANGKNYKTGDYVKRSLVTANVADKLGKGKHYTLISKAADKPTMLQHFYCYPDREFVLTTLEIRGEGLRSNYLAPLLAGDANLYAGSNLSTLLVPYDNDTFIRYSSKKLSGADSTSAEVGVVYDSVSRRGLVIGSLEHDVWKSGVSSAGTSDKINKLQAWAGYSDVKVTRDSMAHGYLSGNSIVSPKMFIGYFNDWRDGLEAYAKVGNLVESRYIKPWTKATPVGWNSWGVIAEHLTYDKAVGVVDFFDKQLPKFRNEDGAAYIDLDSYWDNMTRGGLNGDISELKDFVAYCQSKNLEPGVYWAPFTDWGFKSNNPNRKAEGGDYKFADMWTKTDKGYHDLDGARALDPTHPGTKQRIAFVIGKLKECGFKMIKIDFLGHGAVESTKFYDPKITTGMQAYRIGMEALTDALDNQMLVYAAISPSLATAKYAHMRRIACDSWKSIKDTHYTLNAITYGWWQTYLYDYIDADHLVFEKETEGANKARLMSGLVSGPVILGDDYSKKADWQAQVAKWLQLPEVKQVYKSGKAFKPVDGNAGDGTAQAFVRKDGGYTYVAVFNYKTQPANFKFDLARLGLTKGGKYSAQEILDNTTIKVLGTLEASFKTEGAHLYKISSTY